MSRKALAPVNVLSAAADPTIPTLRVADLYVNSTTKALRSYDGAAWHEYDTLDLASSSSGAKTFTGGIVANSAITGSGTVVLTGVGASSVAGTLGATAFVPSGLTGSTAATRYVGGTATGAPTTGAHVVGDWVTTQDGHIFICTVAGTPGTWVNAGAALTAATTVTSGTAYGAASAVGTSTNYAREDHAHGTPPTPVTSAVAGTGIGVSGATGAVTITNTGALLTANTFTGLQTFNAGLTIPVGQPLTTGTRSVVTGARTTTTNASDTVDLGTFSTTGGALELRIHAHLAAPAAGTTASVTKIYEVATNATMGTVSTWYLCLPADASANAAATNDFALEVNRTALNTFVFRFRQKSIGVAGLIAFTAETLGDTAVTFTASTTVTAAPAAVSTPHPSNAFVAAAGNIGIGTDAPTVLLHVNGAAQATTLNTTGNLTENGNRVYSAGNAPPYPVTSVATRTGAITLTSADVSGVADLSTTQTIGGAKTFTSTLSVSGGVATTYGTAPSFSGLNLTNLNAATATNTAQIPYMLTFNGNYWNGTTSINFGTVTIGATVLDATGTTQLRFSASQHTFVGTLSEGTNRVYSAVNPGRVTTAKTAAYTAAYGDIVLASAATAFTVTLPAATVSREPITVKKTDASTNAVTVAPTAGTIDGAATVAITTRYQSYDFVSDGTNWFII